MAALRLTDDHALAASRQGRIAPPEPPGITPLPAEPDRPAPPETEPPRPDTDEPGIVPEEYPQREDDTAPCRLRCA
jgi:hypothetical protein